MQSTSIARDQNPALNYGSNIDALSRYLLERLGFLFDPFLHVEASSDPYLGRYLVGLDQFYSAWTYQPACIFAPGGGGKTAMRVFTVRTSWLSEGGPHPFPITCVPKEKDIDPGNLPSDDQRWRYLARRAAATAFLGLVHRPGRFLTLDRTNMHLLVDIWSSTLAERWSRYRAIACESQEVDGLAIRIDKSYRHVDASPSRDLLTFCATLNTIQPRTHLKPKNWKEIWTVLTNLIQGPLGFGPVFLLLDGLDGFPTTIRNPERSLDWLEWFLDNSPVWTHQGVFVKAFLPTELQPLIREHASIREADFQFAELRWTPELLAEMLRLRVAAATEDRAGSLDAFSSPDLRDVETVLVSHVQPLPRSVLKFARLVLNCWMKRTAESERPLAMQDIKYALELRNTQILTESSN